MPVVALFPELLKIKPKLLQRLTTKLFRINTSFFYCRACHKH